MSRAELWHGLGGWRWIAYSLVVGISVDQLAHWLFEVRRGAWLTLVVVGAGGAGWAWARYRRALQS